MICHMGQGPYGPGPIWARAHVGQGPRPIWARAHVGPGPLGPGPFLVGRTPHQKTHPGKKSPNCVFLLFSGNKKDARRPYDHFGGGIAPRSLLCVRKRRFPFLKPRCFCAAKMLFGGKPSTVLHCVCDFPRILQSTFPDRPPLVAGHLNFSYNFPV